MLHDAICHIPLKIYGVNIRKYIYNRKILCSLCRRETVVKPVIPVQAGISYKNLRLN